MDSVDGHLCSNASTVIAAEKPDGRKSIGFNVTNNLCRVFGCLKSFLTHSVTRLATRFDLHFFNYGHMRMTLSSDESLGKQKKRANPESNAIRLSLAGRGVKKRLHVFSLVWTDVEKGELSWHTTVEKAAWDITVAPSRASRCQMMGFPALSRGPSWSGTRTRADAIWWWRARDETAKLCQRDQNLLIIFSHLFMWEVVFSIKTAIPRRVTSS